jgi:flagellar hook-length control protein FliK
VAAALQAMEPALKDLPKDATLPGKELPPKSVEGVPANTVLTAAAGTAGAAPAVDQPAALPAVGHPPDTRLVDKVVQEARWMLRDNHQEVTIRLEPEHLGNLKLHVTQKDGAMHVEMTVDTAAAKHLLDANISQLRERFQQENLAQGQLLHVDVRQGGNSEFARQFGRQGSDAAGVAGIGHAAPGEETAAAAPRAAWSNSNVSIYA